MKTATRASKFDRANTLNEKWNLLSKARKRYARHLVERWGWPVETAAQQAYIFGFSPWSYDRRAKRAVREDVTAKVFGL